MNPRQLPTLLLATSALAFLLAGCSPASSHTRDSNSGNSPQFANDFAAAYTHLHLIGADADAFDCGCYYEEDGFDSFEQCMTRTSVSHADRNNVMRCTYNLILDLPPAPGGVHDYVIRYQRTDASYQYCKNLGADDCSGAESERQSDCRAPLVAEFEARPTDEASMRWLQLFDDAVMNAGCY
ncbi:hypothetical protein DV096_18930 [Bradymonadaceae bacterium TMQ3]|nr:hypothetical protein DV096_18930 [Bradymonadaceae bacterium TMQ3]TXC74579.1 hypothetical protein FRC91_15825 [Bradymonadales bacterium TMQ1]